MHTPTDHTDTALELARRAFVATVHAVKGAQRGWSSPKRLGRRPQCRPLTRFVVEIKARGGSRSPCTTSTTRNEEIGCKPGQPCGLRRHGHIFVVAAPRRCKRHRHRRGA
jgi:hypothetical protein